MEYVMFYPHNKYKLNQKLYITPYNKRDTIEDTIILDEKEILFYNQFRMNPILQDVLEKLIEKNKLEPLTLEIQLKIFLAKLNTQGIIKIIRGDDMCQDRMFYETLSRIGLQKDKMYLINELTKKSEYLNGKETPSFADLDIFGCKYYYLLNSRINDKNYNVVSKFKDHLIKVEYEPYYLSNVTVINYLRNRKCTCLRHQYIASITGYEMILVYIFMDMHLLETIGDKTAKYPLLDNIKENIEFFKLMFRDSINHYGNPIGVKVDKYIKQ